MRCVTAPWIYELELDDEGWAHQERIFDYRTSADGLAATFERLAVGEISPIKILVEYQPCL